MIKITADYHTHTVFSHGKNTVEQNVVAAIEKGLKKIVISDHGPAHIFFGVKKNKFSRYLQEIDRARQKFCDKIDVLTGIELNVLGLDGQIDNLYDQDDKFDIKILGYHKAVYYSDLQSYLHFNFKDRIKNEKLQKIIIQKTTQSYIKAIKKGNIDIIAHPNYGVQIDILKVAKECIISDVLIEINSSHNELSYKQLQKMIHTDVSFVVASDAHTKENVGNFDRAIKFIKLAGIKKQNIMNAK